MRGVASVIPNASDAHTHVVTPPCKSYYTHLRYKKQNKTQTLCTATKHDIHMGLKQACSDELHNHENSLGPGCSISYRLYHTRGNPRFYKPPLGF